MFCFCFRRKRNKERKKFYIPTCFKCYEIVKGDDYVIYYSRIFCNTCYIIEYKKRPPLYHLDF